MIPKNLLGKPLLKKGMTVDVHRIDGFWRKLFKKIFRIKEKPPPILLITDVDTKNNFITVAPYPPLVLTLKEGQNDTR